MNTLTLIRSFQGDSGTFGNMGEWVSGELPWHNNDQSISCIPPGTYTCEWLVSPKHPDGKYHVTNVPGRDAVEIHSGNFCGDVSKGYQSDVLGCILLGKEKGHVNNKFGNLQDAVVHSTDAIKDFETKMAKQPFTLTISYL